MDINNILLKVKQKLKQDTAELTEVVKNDVFEEFRVMKRDLIEPYRFLDSTLEILFKSGIKDLSIRRPDAKFGESVNSNWHPALVHYLLFKAYSLDSNDQADSEQSNQYFQMYEKEIRSVTFYFSDDDLHSFLLEGIREVHNLRPDASYNDDLNLTVIPDISYIPLRLNSTVYSVGNIVRGSDNEYRFCVSSGTSHTEEPIWLDDITIDGTVSWYKVASFLNEIWSPVLQNYILSRCYSIEHIDEEDARRFQFFNQQFINGVRNV